MGNNCACVSDKNIKAGNKELVQDTNIPQIYEDIQSSAVKIQAHIRGTKVRRTYKSMKSEVMNSDQTTTPHAVTKMMHFGAIESDSANKASGNGTQIDAEQLFPQNEIEVKLLQTGNVLNTHQAALDGSPGFSKAFHQQENGFMRKANLSKRSMVSSSKNGIKFLEDVPSIRNQTVQALLKQLPPFPYSSFKELNQKSLHLPTFGPVLLGQGVVYIGQWKLHAGNGTSNNLINSNQNDVINGVRHGKGKQIWPDGSVYEGFWSEDQAEGYGRLIHTDGDYYEGEWLNDKAHGKGKYFHLDGAFYEGDWVRDSQEGHGVEHYSDGSVYTGEFLSGMKQGKGAFSWQDGSTYIGEFRNDKLEGKGRYVWSDGRVYEGEWADSQMNGYGVFTWKDGRRYEGNYQNDKKEGFGIYYLGDGRRYEGQWKDGLQDGKGVFISSSGKSRAGYWSQGKRLQWESSISHSGATSKNEQIQ